MSDSTKAAFQVGDTKFESGATRSGDRNHLDFTSLPLIGVIGAAAAAGEGKTKYGRLNFMLGMPVHDLLNHAFGHLVMHLLGDRSESHLCKFAWNALAAVQSDILDPAISTPHMLGPGATLTPAVISFLEENAPALSARRAAGDFNALGGWKIRDIPEIATILAQRDVTLNPPCDPEPLTEPESVVEKVKKKRRTKAEMESARAAESGEAPPVDNDHVADGATPFTPEEVSINAEPTDDAIEAMDAE